MDYKTVKVEAGRGGWGTPLEIKPKEGQKIVCVTGGKIHPVAQKIAELTGAPVIEGLRNAATDEETACAVINCGGIARCGIYPKKGILTINVNGGKPSGPMKRFIKEGLYVSGVTEKEISLIEE